MPVNRSRQIEAVFNARQRIRRGLTLNAFANKVPAQAGQTRLQVIQILVVIERIMAQAVVISLIHHLQEQASELADFFFLLADNLLPVLMFLVAGIYRGGRVNEGHTVHETGSLMGSEKGRVNLVAQLVKKFVAIDRSRMAP